MMWGLAAGLPAGLVGGAVARATCVPTGLLIGWIAGVARWSAAAPLGRLGVAHVLALGALVLTGALLRSRRARLGLVVLASVVLCHPALALAAGPPASGTDLIPGAHLWQAGGATVLVVDRARPEQLLRAVHAAGVRTLDLLVLTHHTRGTTAAAASLLARVPARAVAAPPGVTVAGAHPVPATGEVDVGPMAVHMRPAPDAVEVEVGRR